MKIAALAGGVGGAKLAHGLAQRLPSDDLTVIVNTGDDFEHYGLYISPDIDTVCYTLAGLSNPDTGWGRRCETWNIFEELKSLNGPVWFRLGDKDLATHLERTRLLRSGLRLSEVTRRFCDLWGVNTRILPMSEQPVKTIVHTRKDGNLPFQDYFVARQCVPEVTGFEFQGIAAAQPAPGVETALKEADAVVFCPSNPWVSIDPILAVPGVRDFIAGKVVVAVSPIIGDKTVKGPAAKMFRELGIPSTASAVAEHYEDILKGYLIDTSDKKLMSELDKKSMTIKCTRILMKNEAERQKLAEEVLEMCELLLATRNQ